MLAVVVVVVVLCSDMVLTEAVGGWQARVQGGGSGGPRVV